MVDESWHKKVSGPGLQGFNGTGHSLAAAWEDLMERKEITLDQALHPDKWRDLISAKQGTIAKGRRPRVKPS